jgi:hypothetical protein
VEGPQPLRRKSSHRRLAARSRACPYRRIPGRAGGGPSSRPLGFEPDPGARARTRAWGGAGGCGRGCRGGGAACAVVADRVRAGRGLGAGVKVERSGWA